MNNPTDEFDLFASETDTEFRMLGRYINAVELGIDRIREEESEELKRRREIPGTGLLEILNPEIDHIIAHGEEIPRIPKYTQIVALYSFLETRFGLLCEEINRRQPEQHRKPIGFAENIPSVTQRILCLIQNSVQKSQLWES